MKDTFEFLPANTNIADEIRQVDWRLTTLGRSGKWPQSLRTTLSNLLQSPFPSVLVWKHDTSFFNEAYRTTSGNQGLQIGATGQETLGEMWGALSPWIHKLMNGKPEDVFGSTSVRTSSNEPVQRAVHYSGVFDEQNDVAGVLFIFMEPNDIRHEHLGIKDETRYRFALTAGQIGTWELDLSSLQLNASDLCKANFGRPVDQPFTYEMLKSQIHPDDLSRMEHQVNETILTGKDYNIEYRILWPDQSIHWVTIRGQLYYDERHQPSFMLGVSIDITDKKSTKEAIRESEARFGTLIKHSSVAIVVLEGPAMTVADVNQAYGKLILRTPEELLGRPIFSVVPESQEMYLPILEKVRRSGQSVTLYDAPYTASKDGTLVEGYLHIVTHPYRDEKGNIIGVMQILQDVTESVRARKALEESEARFRLMANAIPEVIWVADSMGNNEFFNKRWEQFSGVPFEATHASEIAGRFLHPDDAPLVMAAFSDAIKNVKPMEIEQRNLSASGEYRWFLNRAMPYLDPGTGKVEKWFGIGIDIHARKQIEKALNESEAKFRSVVSNAPAAISLLVGRELIIEHPNQAFIDIVGRGWEIAGKPLREAMPDLFSGYQGSFNILNNVFVSGEMFRSTATPVKIERDGVPEEKFYDFTYSPLYNTTGEVWAILSIAIDVTDQIRSREELRQSREQFKTITETIPQLVWVCNPDGEVIHFNRRWYELTGSTPAESIGHQWLNLVHPDDAEATREKWNQARAGAIPLLVEYRLRTADHHYRWMLSHGIPIIVDGEVEQWFGTCTDIHERKHFAQLLAERVAQRTFELQRSNEDLQQFAHVASHDLKEPVRKIKTFANLIESGYGAKLDDRVKMYLAKIQRSTDRMYSMIEGVLRYSTLIGSPPTAGSVDLTQTIENIVDDLEVVIETLHASINYGILPIVEGDDVLLYQLFYNLINNSLKFRNPSVPLIIDITFRMVEHPTEDFVEITLADNGIGFEQMYAATIFETFVRLHPKDSYEGTGLGLALCRKIVERHRGTIQASGQRDVGATFTITLPLKQSFKADVT